MLSEKISGFILYLYLKQLTTGKAWYHQDEKMYAASVLKLPYLYYAQKK